MRCAGDWSRFYFNILSILYILRSIEWPCLLHCLCLRFFSCFVCLLQMWLITVCCDTSETRWNSSRFTSGHARWHGAFATLRRFCFEVVIMMLSLSCWYSRPSIATVVYEQESSLTESVSACTMSDLNSDILWFWEMHIKREYQRTHRMAWRYLD